jgi:predicted DCC family thiol-disulfide oxidoreductase YuxK
VRFIASAAPSFGLNFDQKAPISQRATDPFMPKSHQPITIAFDGDCLMCSRSIRWVAERDAADQVRFTRLQDEMGQKMAAASGGAPLDSMLVRSGDQVLDRSTGVLAVMKTLGFPWSVAAGLGKLIPRTLRDRLYNYIADHRYQWFGKGDACSMPSEALRRRLLPEPEG